MVPWTRNETEENSVAALDLSLGDLIEAKVEGTGILLRIMELERRTTAGRPGKAIVVCVATEAEHLRLKGKEIPFHLCKGEASRSGCSRFTALKGLHIDAVRRLSYAQAVPLSWMKDRASAIRADEALVLGTGRRDAATVSSFDDLVSLPGVGATPVKSGTPVAKSPPLAKSPAPRRGSPQSPTPDPLMTYGKLLSQAEALRKQHGLPGFADSQPLAPLPAVQKDDRLDLHALIHGQAESHPGALSEKWLAAVTFSTRKIRNFIAPCVVDFVDQIVRNRVGDNPRALRELQSIGLAMDNLIEFKGWESTPATARTMDVLTQRFKSAEYAAVMMHKLSSKDISRSARGAKRIKIWEQSMRYELLPMETMSIGSREARAVAKDYRDTEKVMGRTMFTLTDSDDDEGSDDSASSAGSSRKKKRKRKKGKKKGAAKKKSESDGPR